MNFRKENVSSVLTEFLLRYSPPQNIRNNQKAQQAEAELLLKVLLRYRGACALFCMTGNKVHRLPAETWTLRPWRVNIRGVPHQKSSMAFFAPSQAGRP